MFQGGNFVDVQETGKLVVRGGKIGRGLAFQAGDGGSRVAGVVYCSDYNASDAGGCISGGKQLKIESTGKIFSDNGYAESAGGVLSSDSMLLEGEIYAKDISTGGAGGILSADNVEMKSAKIVGNRIVADGGPVITFGIGTISGSSLIKIDHAWGGGKVLEILLL